jgi:hypothetical protein
MRLYNTKREVVEMFVDNTAGESTPYNRLQTFETESGDVKIVGHTWNTLAKYNESEGVVTVFTGWTHINSTTTNGYLNLIADIARERGRTVSISGESPVHDSPTEATDYINNYVSMDGGHSAVEQDAVDHVVEELTA